MSEKWMTEPCGDGEYGPDVTLGEIERHWQGVSGAFKRERDEARTALGRVIQERDAALLAASECVPSGELALCLAHTERVADEWKREAGKMRSALKRLSYAAQTTGGAAGRDTALVDAIAEASIALSGTTDAMRPASDGWKLVPVEATEAMISAGWIDKEDVDPSEIYRAMLAASPAAPAPASDGWRPIESAPSAKAILIAYTNRSDKWRIVRAVRYERLQSEQEFDEFDTAEYCEEKDAYFIPAGWYELIDNWDDFSSIPINEGKPTFWRDLPTPPAREDSTRQP